jgi:hypothetical protein
VNVNCPCQRKRMMIDRLALPHVDGRQIIGHRQTSLFDIKIPEAPTAGLLHMSDKFDTALNCAWWGWECIGEMWMEMRSQPAFRTTILPFPAPELDGESHRRCRYQKGASSSSSRLLFTRERIAGYRISQRREIQA